MVYLYKEGDIFRNTDYTMKILRKAKMDEFGCDFYWAEQNYVVVFYDKNGNLIDDKPLASYNITRNNKFNYVMNEGEIMSWHAS